MERPACLVSGRTESITRYRLSALLTLPASAMGHVGLDELGFDEVLESIDALRVAVIQQDHRERRVFRPREQEWLAQASIISHRRAVRQRKM